MRQHTMAAHTIATTMTSRNQPSTGPIPGAMLFPAPTNPLYNRCEIDDRTGQYKHKARMTFCAEPRNRTIQIRARKWSSMPHPLCQELAAAADRAKTEISGHLMRCELRSARIYMNGF